jgi:hypothetical protein
VSSLAHVNCGLVLGHLDLSAVSNSIELTPKYRMAEASVLSSSAKVEVPTLVEISGKIGGFLSDTAEGGLFASRGQRIIGISMPSPQGREIGQRAELFSLVSTAYQPSAKIGELWSFNLDVSGRGDALAVGRVLSPGESTITATGPLPHAVIALPAGGRLALCVLGTYSGSATVVLESDGDADFATPITRATATLTAGGGSWISVPPAAPDTYCRLNVTALSAPVRLAGALGVL